MKVDVNCYACLGLPRDATPEEIRNAYFEAARRMHPDVTTDPAAHERFFQIQQAYEILSQPDNRASYDARLPAEVLLPPDIEIKTSFSRSSLFKVGESQLVYALVEISYLNKSVKVVNPPRNMCLVLDRSTSMAGARIETIKASAIRLVRAMREQDVFSIVVFSDHPEVLISPVRAPLIEKIEAQISKLQASGGTEIFPALELGLNQVRQQLDPGSVNHLVLLTDGRTYGDEDACTSLAKQAVGEGVGISCLGIGYDWNDVLLDDLAGISGGVSGYISNPKEIVKLLEDVFANLGQTYADLVSFSFSGDEHAHLNYAYRLQAEAAPLSLESPLVLGSVRRDVPLNVLLEFFVEDFPPTQDEMIMAKGSLMLKIPNRLIPMTRLSLDLTRPVGERMTGDAPPLKIVKGVEQMSLYRLQEKARQAVQAGEYSKATKQLQSLATRLLAAGDRELAKAVLLEVDSIDKKKTYSQEGEKQIKYGTRRLPLNSVAELSES